RNRLRHASSRTGSDSGGVWQKKLTLNGLVVPRAIAASSARIWSTDSSAHGSEPSPPAFETAIASALPCTPAIGAWMTGSSIPSSSLTDGILSFSVRLQPNDADAAHRPRFCTGAPRARPRQARAQRTDAHAFDPPRHRRWPAAAQGELGVCAGD